MDKAMPEKNASGNILKNSGTVYFKTKPRIQNTFTIVGPKEAESELGDLFDVKLESDLFEEKTFEKAECKMLSYAVKGLLKKSKLNEADIGALVMGDLLNQIVSSSFTARDYDVPFLGVYAACSTITESLILASTLIDAGHIDKAVCAVGSHFSTAERQYRYPLELGCIRPPQSQWTVTGSGAFLLGSGGDFPKITNATIGKVIDFGVTDANNMGAAMAPACAETLTTHFVNTRTRPEDYDLIVTGDLGALGTRLLKHLMVEKNLPIDKNHVDCGELMYSIDEGDYQGGSGAGCSTVVVGSYIYKKLLKKQINRVLFAATGALLSTLTTQQGESIPGVSHAITLEI